MLLSTREGVLFYVHKNLSVAIAAYTHMVLFKFHLVMLINFPNAKFVFFVLLLVI